MYVTAFDKRYAAKGIAMVLSLRNFDRETPLTVLCIDMEAQLACEELFDYSEVTVIRLEDLGVELIKSIRRSREYREFCWTLGALLCRHLLRQGVDEVIYLDADIYFFNNPEALLLEARTGDIAAIEHRFPPRLKSYQQNGIFNVQWIYIRNSEIGKRAAERWANQCISNCSYDPENGVVGDQKYLDEWPHLYQTFVTIMNPGAGVAPWNYETLNPRKLAGTWKVGDGNDLIFYHFHGFGIGEDGRITLSGPIYTEVTALPIELYREYIVAISQIESRIKSLTGTVDPLFWKISDQKSFFRRVVRSIQRRVGV